MAPRCGTRSDSSRGLADRTLHALGRLVGFGLLAGLGVAILGCVVLLPAQARLLQTRYELECNRALNADYADRSQAEAFLIEGLQQDHVLVQRAAADALGGPYMPRLNESSSLPAVALHVSPNPRPAPPSGWVVRTAQRLEDIRIRRGLCVLSAVAILAALLLFSNPAKYVALREEIGTTGAGA